MRLSCLILLSAITIAATSYANSSSPANLLRYNTGSVPVLQADNGAWSSAPLDSVAEQSPATALLTGDIGSTIDLSTLDPKTIVVDLGTVESINRFSLQSITGQGSLTIFSSPVFEDPTTGSWSQLGQITFAPGEVGSLNATPTEARYLRFVFSPDSSGTVGSLGGFGSLTYQDLSSPNILQPTGLQPQPGYSLNYASPATQMTVVSPQTTDTANSPSALFDDDAATQYTVTTPTQITVDLGGNRQIASLYLSGSQGSSASLQFADSPEGLQSAKAISISSGSSTTTSEPINARYARISLSPTGPTTPAMLGGIALVGPVSPDALVFDRIGQDVSATAAAAGAGGFTGGLPPVAPVIRQVISN